MSANQWTVFLQIQDKCKMLILQNPESMTVADFKKKVQEECGLEPEHQRLLLNHRTPLEDGKRLSDYDMGDNAQVDVVQRVKGGSKRKVDPSVSRCKGPCMLTYEDCDEPECVTMQCGHVIHPDALMKFCYGEVYDKHKWVIQCFHPGCKGVYSIGFLVKCGITKEELDILTKGMTGNCFRNSHLDADIVKCPGCRFHCERIDKSTNVVRCDLCTRKSGKSYDFCWQCSLPWTHGHQCQVSKTSDILATCAEKIINNVKCPAIRSCPKCGFLIEHKEACKHMKCPKCQQDFCFVCLQLKTTAWQCGGFNTPCEPAPIQTTSVNTK